MQCDRCHAVHDDSVVELCPKHAAADALMGACAAVVAAWEQGDLAAAARQCVAALAQAEEGALRHQHRQELIALLPQLVDAADMMLGLARPSRNTIPAITEAFPKQANVIREARRLFLLTQPKGGAK